MLMCAGAGGCNRSRLMCKESLCEDGFETHHKDPRHLLVGTFNLLKPTGYVMHQQV